MMGQPEASMPAVPNDSSSGSRDPVELLAEEFLERRRGGDRPTIDEYAAEHPELAGAIRAAFPALLMMEGLGGSSLDASGPDSSGSAAVGAGRPERLGDYRILRQVGRGGMGVVYEAEQESLGRRVALKILTAGALPDPNQVRRFEREARAAARLHHTNIVPVFGVGHECGQHYYVMQFITGLGLDAVLDELRRLRDRRDIGACEPASEPLVRVPSGVTAAAVAQSLISGRFAADDAPEGGPGAGSTESFSVDPPQSFDPASVHLPGSSELSAISDSDWRYTRSVARIGEQVAEALAYAHGQGILHRDIKPSNLLLDLKGNVWVADFGLAKASADDNLTHTGDIVGTLRYMAPERFEGRSDERSDVYALGLTLYELLALRPAFDAADRGTLIRQVTQEEPPLLRKRNPTVPRDLATIVHKAISREPGDRYASAEAMGEDLRRFVADVPIRARRASSIERLARWARRHPAVAGLTAALAAVCLAAFVVVSWQLHLRERELYTSDMLAIQQAWEAGDIVRMGELLQRHVPGPFQTDWRGFEWYVFRSLHDRARAQVLETFTLNDVPSALGATPNSQVVAAWIYDHPKNQAYVTRWNAASGGKPRTFLGPEGGRPGGIEGPLALAPDGRRFAAGSHFDERGREGNFLNIWDARTGEILHRLGSGVDGNHVSLDNNALAFSNDGRWLISASENMTPMIWDLATGQVMRTFQAPAGAAHSGGIRGVAISPDGSWIASAGRDYQVKLWSVASGEVVHVGEFSSVATQVDFSPDGRYLAAGSWGLGAQAWDLSDPRRPRAIELRGQPKRSALGVSFSADGRYLATSNDNLVTLWRVEEGDGWESRATLKGHSNQVWFVAFLDGGKSLASAGMDRTIKLWDITCVGARSDVLQGHSGSIYALAFEPDGRTLVSADGYGTLKRWDVSTGSEGPPLEVPPKVQPVVGVEGRDTIWFIGIHERTLADNRGRLWDLKSGKLLEPLPLPERAPYGRPVAFSDDGAILANVVDWKISLWDMATRQRRIIEHADPNYGAGCLDIHDRLLASGGADQAVRLWDLTTREQLSVLDHEDGGHRWQVCSVTFSLDGRTLVSASWDGTVKVWDIADPTAPSLRHTLAKHVGMVRAVAISPDGKTIASSSADQTIKLWDPITGRDRCTLVGHTSQVQGLAFSPDGSVLASGDAQGTIRLWRAELPRP